MSNNPGPSNQETVNNFGITTANMAYPLARKAHSAAHAAMGVSGLAKQNEVIIAGDSITANQILVTATHYWYDDVGFYSIAASMAGVAPTYYNYATSGITIQGWSDRWLAATLANPARIVLMLLGANDDFSTPATPVATKISQLTTIFETLVAAGKYVVAVSELPQSTTATRANAVAAQNLFLQNYWSGKSTGEYFPLYTAMADPSGTNTPYKTNYGIVGDASLVHPGNLGAYYAGVAMAPLFERLFVPITLVGSNNDSITVNANSNQLLANPMLLGTAGTAGTNVTGSIATGLTVTGDANTAVVGSVTAANGGIGNKQVLAVTSTGAGLFSAFGDQVIAYCSPGDFITVAARIKLTTSDQVKGFSLYWLTNGGLMETTWHHRSGANNYAYPARMEFLVARVGYTIPAGVNNIRPYFACEFIGAQTTTVFEIEQLEMRNWGKVEHA